MRNKLILAFALLCAAGGSLPSLAATYTGNTNGRPPANSTGAEADYFIDVASGNIYGPKSSGVWPSTPASATSYPGADSAIQLVAPLGGL
jgi:hypothetical protein